MAEDQTNNPLDPLALARNAYDESTSYFDAGVRADIERDLRQFQGLHPTDSKYVADGYRGRSKFFRPKTRAAIRKNEAIAAGAFFGNADVVSIEPEDEEDKTQVAAARLWQEVLNRRLRKDIPWFHTLIGAYQDAQAVGVCISYQCWEYDTRNGVDKPSVELIPVENVRFAPGAKWFDPVNTSPYFIHMIPMFVKDVRAKMKPPREGEDGRWKQISEAELLQGVRGYSDSTTLTRNPRRTDPNAQASATNDYSMVWVHRNIVEIDGKDMMFYTLGTIAMLTNPIPLEDSYAHGKRPYVVGQCVIETHKQYPSGVARLTRDTQGEINHTANTRRDNVDFVLNKRYLVKRGKQVDLRSLSRNMPGSSTLVDDPEKDVKELEFHDVTQSAYEEQDRLNLDFDDVAGVFSQSSVQSNRKLNETVGGMELLTRDASLLGAYQLMTFAKTWAEPVLAQVLAMEQYYETDEELFLRAAKAAQLTSETLVDEHMLMQHCRVNVNVGIGATTPQLKLQNFLYSMKSLREILQDGILQQAGLDLKEVADEVFSRGGYDGASRFFQWGADPMQAQLQQRIQELEDKLKQKEAPELTAAKVRNLDAKTLQTDALKVKAGVEAVFGSMQAGEVIAAVPAVAPIADQVMRAAGYVTPTPPGVDPGFAPGDQGPANPGAPVSPAAGLVTNEIKDPRTGISFTPPGAPAPGTPPQSGNPAEHGNALPAGMPVNTNPLTPKLPTSPFVGENHGIETVRPDTKGPNR